MRMFQHEIQTEWIQISMPVMPRKCGNVRYDVERDEVIVILPGREFHIPSGETLRRGYGMSEYIGAVGGHDTQLHYKKIVSHYSAWKKSLKMKSLLQGFYEIPLENSKNKEKKSRSPETTDSNTGKATTIQRKTPQA